MRKYIALVLLLFIIGFTCIAQAQLSSTGAGKKASGGGGGGSLTFTPTATATAWQNSITPPAVFLTQSIGTASSDRIVVVVITVDGNATNGVISSVLFGASTATQAVKIDPSATFKGVYIYYLLVTTGTTSTITINCNGFPGSIGISVGIITGSATTVISATNTVNTWASPVADPHSITTTVPSNGVGVVGVIVDRALTPTWSNATGDANITDTLGSGDALLMAHTTNNSPSFTGANSFGLEMVAATWGP